MYTKYKRIYVISRRLIVPLSNRGLVLIVNVVMERSRYGINREVYKNITDVVAHKIVCGRICSN